VAGRRGVGYSEAAGALGRGRGGVASVKRCEHGWERGLSMAAAERLLLTCRRGPTGALIRKHPSHKVTTSEQGVQETVRESGAIYLPRRDRMLGSENFATRAAAHHPRRTGLTEFPCGILSPLGFGPAPPVRCRRLGWQTPGRDPLSAAWGYQPPPPELHRPPIPPIDRSTEPLFSAHPREGDCPVLDTSALARHGPKCGVGRVPAIGPLPYPSARRVAAALFSPALGRAPSLPKSPVRFCPAPVPKPYGDWPLRATSCLPNRSRRQAP
jgi:hypothetical protein